METLIQCSVGKKLNIDCHLETFTNKKILHELHDLKQDDVDILYLRIPQIKDSENQTVCSHHYAKYLNYYSLSQKRCCDPWTKHKKNSTAQLQEITVDLSKKISKISNINLIPGKKLCINCYYSCTKIVKDHDTEIMYCIDPYDKHRIKIDSEVDFLQLKHIQYLEGVHKKIFTTEHKICNVCQNLIEASIVEYNKSKQDIVSVPTSSKQCENNDSESPIFHQSTPGSDFESDSQKKRSLDKILSSFDIPPFKRMKLDDNRVVQKGIEIVEEVVSKVSTVFEKAHNVVLPEFENLQKLHVESSWFKDMIMNIKSKFDSSKTIDEKISVLSLLPSSWNFKTTAQYFSCTYYMYCEAKKIRLYLGVLGRRVKKSYLRIPPEIREEIKNYYLNESNSVICSGMKEHVKIKVPGESPITLQKRILIFDLPDLYRNWINDSGHETVPCLTFFAQMRPQQCVFAGDPGTHNICVCSIHQNVKLKLSAITSNLNYKDIIASGVCSVEKKICMLKKCDKCPKIEGIRQFLNFSITNDINFQSVEYNNWGPISVKGKDSENAASTRVTLKTFNEPLDKFLDNLTEDIWNMTEHHFISYCQKDYFVQCKRNLDEGTGLLIMDFAENYTYICQDSTQGFYFNNTSASLFTAALYYKDQLENDIKHKTFCVISDTAIHQAYSVHKFMEVVLGEIKNKYPWIQNLIYFSDGAPTQFKNKNHFINLCWHAKDFGIRVISHNFFATSHGKSVCDGVGGTAKRLARKGSLQGIKILNAQQMYDYLSEKESNICFLYVDDKEVTARGKKLSKRFDLAKTVPNTRQLHYIEPVDEQTIKVKVYSIDTKTDVVKIN